MPYYWTFLAAAHLFREAAEGKELPKEGCLPWLTLLLRLRSVSLRTPEDPEWGLLVEHFEVVRSDDFRGFVHLLPRYRGAEGQMTEERLAELRHSVEAVLEAPDPPSNQLMELAQWLENLGVFLRRHHLSPEFFKNEES